MPAETSHTLRFRNRRLASPHVLKYMASRDCPRRVCPVACPSYSLLLKRILVVTIHGMDFLELR